MSFERRKTKIGTVLSDKMDRTIVVQTEWKNIHRLYKKAMRRTAKLKVHDTENTCGIGDVIEIIEDRPRSKNKRWRLLNVIKKNDQDDVNLDNILTGESLLGIVEPEAETARQICFKFLSKLLLVFLIFKLGSVETTSPITFSVKILAL